MFGWYFKMKLVKCKKKKKTGITTIWAVLQPIIQYWNTHKSWPLCISMHFSLYIWIAPISRRQNCAIGTIAQLLVMSAKKKKTHMLKTPKKVYTCIYIYIYIPLVILPFERVLWLFLRHLQRYSITFRIRYVNFPVFTWYIDSIYSMK